MNKESDYDIWEDLAYQARIDWPAAVDEKVIRDFSTFGFFRRQPLIYKIYPGERMRDRYIIEHFLELYNARYHKSLTFDEFLEIGLDK